jgi:hypothetical protein
MTGETDNTWILCTVNVPRNQEDLRLFTSNSAYCTIAYPTSRTITSELQSLTSSALLSSRQHVTQHPLCSNTFPFLLLSFSSPNTGLGMQPTTGTVIADATRAWELDVHWEPCSHCGVWDPRSRRVNIFECIQDRKSPLHSLLRLPPIAFS